MTTAKEVLDLVEGESVYTFEVVAQDVYKTDVSTPLKKYQKVMDAAFKKSDLVIKHSLGKLGVGPEVAAIQRNSGRTMLALKSYTVYVKIDDSKMDDFKKLVSSIAPPKNISFKGFKKSGLKL